MEDVLGGLVDSNFIGKGSSGIVYRIETKLGSQIAVKKLWPEKKYGDFFAEVKILSSIRHKNIVRLLGCCCNSNSSVRLFMFDYISNGSLHRLLHDSTVYLEWNLRYKIALGSAQGLAYLRHDCDPPIIHHDIKASNILIGQQFEPYLANFGIAEAISHSKDAKLNNLEAGSFGYIAPEYSYSLKITEKSDVYSYGVVLLEILTGFQPADARLPGGHIVAWIQRELRGADVDARALHDEKLLRQREFEIQEMLQALGVGLLCTNAAPEERPTMKDVAAMLKEIRLECRSIMEADGATKVIRDSSKAASCSSFSSSSEPLISSSSSI